MKTTIKQHGVTFTNFPALSCSCGESVIYSSGDLDIAQVLANQLVVSNINADAITVDFEKVNPDLAESITLEKQGELQTMLQNSSRKRLGLSPDEVERIVFDSLEDDEVADSVDCSTLKQN